MIRLICGFDLCTLLAVVFATAFGLLGGIWVVLDCF